jgi:hypothetical protein
LLVFLVLWILATLHESLRPWYWPWKSAPIHPENSTHVAKLPIWVQILVALTTKSSTISACVYITEI